MPIPIKQITKQQTLDELPNELPQMPSDMLASNPQLAQWQTAMNSWWYDLRLILRTDRDKVLDELEKLQSP